MTFSVRLQNSPVSTLRIISKHGLARKYSLSSRRGLDFFAAARLKIPRSPEPEAATAAHGLEPCPAAPDVAVVELYVFAVEPSFHTDPETGGPSFPTVANNMCPDRKFCEGFYRRYLVNELLLNGKTTAGAAHEDVEKFGCTHEVLESQGAAVVADDIVFLQCWPSAPESAHRRHHVHAQDCFLGLLPDFLRDLGFELLLEESKIPFDSLFPGLTSLQAVLPPGVGSVEYEEL